MKLKYISRNLFSSFFVTINSLKGSITRKKVAMLFYYSNYLVLVLVFSILTFLKFNIVKKQNIIISEITSRIHFQKIRENF